MVQGVSVSFDMGDSNVYAGALPPGKSNSNEKPLLKGITI